MKTTENSTANAIVMLSTSLIEPSNYNARKTFNPAQLDELAQSIKNNGLIQPITVRQKGERYEIICGERRFRASMMLKLANIPAIIRNVSDEEAYDLSITENLQREDVPPMEAAEAYKHLINTKRYDVKSLALKYGKSEKHIYQMLKLCDLVKGIAELVRSGKLTASAGIVLSKYDKKTQEAVLKDRLSEDRGEWFTISASVLDSRIKNSYTNDLDSYDFDKSECLKCNFNSKNYDLFAGSGRGDCGLCANKKCLEAKNTLYLVDKAQAVAQSDPKLVFISDQYSRTNDATEKVIKAGYEFKNVQIYNLNQYPTEPTAPEATDYEKPEELEKAQERYGKEQERYEKKTHDLDSLKEQGKIRVYAKIGDKEVKLYYKEVSSKDTKSNEQIISDLKAKKVRNDEIAKEKTAGDIKELLRTDELPKSDFTPTEEQAMYFFMLDKLRRSHYKAIGLKENDYYGLSDEKKQKIVANLTKEQKTVIRRDYLYSHLTERTNTVSDIKGGMLLAFATQHLPEKTATIEAQYSEEYGKKNARLDERIKGLKMQEKQPKMPLKDGEGKAKAKTKTKKADKAQTAKKATQPTKTEVKKEVAPKTTPIVTDAMPTPTALAVIPKTIPAIATTPKPQTVAVAV